MKIIILIALLLFAQSVERHYAEQLYTMVGHLYYEIKLIDRSQNKPSIAIKIDQYLNKVDSTVAGLRTFQPKYCAIADQNKQLLKSYCSSREHYPLIKCLKFFINKLVNRFFQG